MPPRRQKTEPDRIAVADTEKMLLQQFRLHCQKRHPLMRGLRSVENHKADHELHPECIDHVHTKAPQVTTIEEDGDSNS